MDSLKIPKGGSSSNTSASNTGGGSSKPSGSVPITVRFNAGEECIDDIFQSFHSNTTSGSGGGGGGGGGGSVGGGGDSLSSSPSAHHQSHAAPQQSADEVNTRNNFLQGNFFNRKRSGSIEGISPTSAPNLIAVLSSSDATSVGTWKLIKGKVTQTIEDIKSSKSSSQTVLSTVVIKGEPQHEPDSDPEYVNIPSSNSEELPLDPEHYKHYYRGDSGSDIENEILLEGEGERSRLKRGLANLKLKVKAKSAVHHHHHHQHHRHQSHSQSPHKSSLTLSTAASSSNSGSSGGVAPKTMNKDTSPSRASLSGSASSGSLRSGFMRKRRKAPVETAELATPSSPPELSMAVTGGNKSNSKSKGIIAGKKDIEIESGVEMLEDMMPPPVAADDVYHSADSATAVKHERTDLALPLKPIISEGGYVADHSDMGSALSSEPFLEIKDVSSPSICSLVSSGSFRSLIDFNTEHLRKRSKKVIPVLTILSLVAVLKLPIPDFLRGVLACLLTIALIESLWWLFEDVIEFFLIKTPPEKTQFLVPDYSKSGITEIPNNVEEHKTVKAYAGWMCEVNNYDPNNFNISMTKNVYVKLEGTTMRVSTTQARIPKRGMWNDKPIDLKNIIFLEHRIYDLLGCRIELLPLGLARKRYFNRKYPMQLIIKQTSNANIEDAVPIVTTISKRPSTTSSKSDMESIDFKDTRNSSSTSSLTQLHNLKQQNSGENLEERNSDHTENELDFATTVLQADLQQLQDTISSDMTVPCGDEVRLLLFARGDREKEDWYRRFVAASLGEVHDQDLRLPNMRLVNDADLQAAAARAAVLLTNPGYKELNKTTGGDAAGSGLDEPLKTHIPDSSAAAEEKSEKRTVHIKASPDMEVLGSDAEKEDEVDTQCDEETFDGLLMNWCAARNPADYLRFMALYQGACRITQIPVYRNLEKPSGPQDRKQRRNKRQEDELWKGIDQSLFLGPSGSVVWFNVFVGRILYSCLNDSILQVKIQDFLQKKLSSIKMPSFMEDVVITQINLGNVPPLIHRISRPMMDERGTWLDADITYEGLMQMTVTTKLNFMRLKRTARTVNIIDTPGAIPAVVPVSMSNLPPINVIPEDYDPDGIGSLNLMLSAQSMSLDRAPLADELATASAIFDSDAESSGGSSSEAESPVAGASGEATNANDFNVFNTAPGNARRIFKIVDRLAASNLFQYATELSYVQRAMENMSANITLRVDLKGLVGRGTINLPPPPSDRIWLCFRGPPRLWISAKPALGEKSFDWSIVTSIIESKLCEAVNKYLVYPNMVDVTIPFLGQPTYKESN